MAAKFRRIGLGAAVAGRCHSFEDVPHGKPAPDVFLAAARAQGVQPAECVVVEDSVPGARGAAAAGMCCLGYAAHTPADALEAAGAAAFRSMAELPALLALAPVAVR
jgi:beta-phosphoglucomutase-like phosphatase (HAD superfamily)